MNLIIFPCIAYSCAKPDCDEAVMGVWTKMQWVSLDLRQLTQIQGDKWGCCSLLQRG